MHIMHAAPKFHAGDVKTSIPSYRTPSPAMSVDGSHNRSRNSMDDVKRANHNALERKRRIHQKEKLQELRAAVPELRDSKPSAVDILLKSTEHIGQLRARHDQHELEIQALRELSKTLQDRLRLCANGAELDIPADLMEGTENGDYAPESSVSIARSLSIGRSISVSLDDDSFAAVRSRVNSVSMQRVESPVAFDRKRPSRDEEALPTRQRKISRSESFTGHDSDTLPDDVILLQNFCEMAQRHSISWDPERHQSISEEPGDHDDGVFDMEAHQRARAASEGMPSTAATEGRVTRSRANGTRRRHHPDDEDDTASSGSGEVDVLADSGVNSKQSVRSPDNADDGEEITCHCRKGWGGKFMIMCDKCNTWFHGECVGVQPRRTPKTFYCSGCRKKR